MNVFGSLIVILTIQVVYVVISDNIVFRRMELKKQEIMGLGRAKKCLVKQKVRSHFWEQNL